MCADGLLATPGRLDRFQETFTAAASNPRRCLGAPARGQRGVAPAGTLVGYARGNTAQAVALAAALNASVPVDTSLAPASCPTNSGAVYTEAFSYGDAGSTMATSSLNGCAMTTVNGRAAWTSTVALNILATLVGEQRPATSLILGPQPSGGH